MARHIKEIIIHAASTPPSMDIGAKEIDRWHRAKGWLGIGYHFVIRRSGEVEVGRDLNTAGAHARGHNRYSVGICLVGGLAEGGDPNKGPFEANFTDKQWSTLDYLIFRMETLYPDARTIGHRDVDPHKACPCFDVAEWLAWRARTTLD